MNPILLLLVLTLIAIPAFAALVWLASVAGLWTYALFAGVPISPRLAARCSFRRNPAPKDLLLALLRLKRAGLAVPPESLEAHARAGGNCADVANHLILAQQAGATLTFDQACAEDLARRTQH